MNYLMNIWRARYFWFYLTLSDLRSRWQRSYFGFLWSVIQPLGLTVLIALVFSKLFNAHLGTYAPYILSGIIVWDCVVSSVSGGSLSFVQADAYIKQTKHPLAIYTLRCVLGNCIVLGIAILAFVLWSVIVLPENFGWHCLFGLLILPVLFLILWPLVTLLAYIAVIYRDLPHGMTLLMQGLWFISPVYFKVELFNRGGLNFLVDYNPVYHVLQIIRAPFLQGALPTLYNFAFSLFTAIIFMFFAWVVGRKAEKRVIYYL